MDVVGERCAHVMGRSAAAGGSGTSAPDTAVGVFHGIRACLAHAFGSDDPSGRTIVVEGPGAVGGPLADLLADAGAKLVVVRHRRGSARRRGRPRGRRRGAGRGCVRCACDVFSPCATGAVLNAETIPRLRCRIVAGAANNQLATPEDADRLAAAGILYAPDYVVNAGGRPPPGGLRAFRLDPRARWPRGSRGSATRCARCSRRPIATASRPRAAASRSRCDASTALERAEPLRRARGC